MFQGGHNLAIKQALNRPVPNTEVQSQPICFKEDAITLPCNQSRVSILTSVLSVYMLQSKLTDVITIPTPLSVSHD